MFNPKGNNLLDQQLSVSGANHYILDILTGGASSRNETRRKNEEAAKKHQGKIAKIQNKHNRKLDKADKENYYAMRDHTHKTNMLNWQRGKQIQDYEYASQLKQYQKSQEIGQAQLGLNAQAEALGFDAEKAAIEETLIQAEFQHQASMSALQQTYDDMNFQRREQGLQLMGIKNQATFGAMSIQNEMDRMQSQTFLQKESAMVESLVAQGVAQASGQAGKSTAKTQQSNMANLHRSLMTLDTELSGKRMAASIQLAEIAADASLQTMGVGLNIERIDKALENSESEAQANLEVLDANMQSAIRQAERNVKQIRLDRQVADLNTRAAMMIKPERLPYEPQPILPPERKFVKRMKVLPGFVPKAQQENLFAAGLNTIGQVVSTVATGVNAVGAIGDAGGIGAMFNNAFGGGTQQGARRALNTF